MLDIIGQCEGPKGQKRNSRVNQCRLLGVEQTSISGGWTSESSQTRTLADHQKTALSSTLRCRWVGAVHSIKGGSWDVRKWPRDRTWREGPISPGVISAEPGRPPPRRQSRRSSNVPPGFTSGTGRSRQVPPGWVCTSGGELHGPILPSNPLWLGTGMNRIRSVLVLLTKRPAK